MAQIAYIDQLPAITEGMIRLLPSYTKSEPIQLKEFEKIPIRGKFNTVGEVIAKIKANINLMRPSMKIKYEEMLEIQLAIIEHGYEGMCPNDYAAKQILSSLRKAEYKPKFEI